MLRSRPRPARRSSPGGQTMRSRALPNSGTTGPEPTLARRPNAVRCLNCGQAGRLDSKANCRRCQGCGWFDLRPYHLESRKMPPSEEAPTINRCLFLGPSARPRSKR